jgi:hypothetical protein
VEESRFEIGGGRRVGLVCFIGSTATIIFRTLV